MINMFLAPGKNPEDPDAGDPVLYSNLIGGTSAI